MVPLLERQQPLAALAAHWQAARAGAGGVALLEGEAGIGKTSVVRELARTAGGRIVVGGCDAMSTPRPLGPVVEIASQLSAELADMLSGGRTEGLYGALLAELARPTLVVVEDAHWADAATLDLLRYLGRRIARLPSLLLVTFRDDEVGPRHPLRVVIGDLATTGTLRRVTLERLSVAAVGQLARDSALDPQDLHRRSGGNPFFVTEAIAANTVAIPPTVRDAVLARFARLDDDARATTELVATLHANAHLDTLVALLGDRCSLEPALDAGILVRGSAAISFRHELGREAVLSAIPPDRQRALHRAAVAALAVAPAGHQLAALAHHAEAAGDADAARRWSVAAARHAVQLRSHREAAAQYARAARSFPDTDRADRAEVLEAWAYEEYLTGHPAESAALRVQVAEMWHRLGDELRHGDNLRWVSRVSWFAGRRADADRYAARAIETLAAQPPGRELAAAWSNQAQLAMLANDPRTAIRIGKRAHALAREVGDREIELHALSNIGTARLLRGELAGAAEVERSIAAAKELHLEEHVGRGYTNLSTSLLALRETPRALAAFRDGIAYCDDHDLDAWRIYMLGWRAMAEVHAGDLDAAVDTALYTLARAAAPPSRVHPLVVLGRVRARRGDPDVWAPLDEALAIAIPANEFQRLGAVRIVRAEAAWLAGDHARARDEAEAGLAVALPVESAWAAGELVMYAQLAGARPRTIPSWLAKPYAQYARRRFAAAAASWAKLGGPYEHALAIAGPGTEPALRAAFAELERARMPGAAAAMTRQLRELGVRSIPRGQRATTRANAAGLTAREAEVLDQLALGLRNADIAKRLFISEKTVGHHVSAILAKLALPDRAAAARWRQSREPRTPI
nr:AAA family ATPase [Kofleriaceae bacterium]